MKAQTVAAGWGDWKCRCGASSRKNITGTEKTALINLGTAFYQGCVRGRHGRGQGQGQIISDSRPRTPVKSYMICEAP